jgi:hypothetical protein
MKALNLVDTPMCGVHLPASQLRHMLQSFLPCQRVEINIDTRRVYKYCKLENEMVWFGQFLYLTGWEGECLYYLLQLASRGGGGLHFNYLLTYDSYGHVHNRFHKGECITWASGEERALYTPGPLNGIEQRDCHLGPGQ